MKHQPRQDQAAAGDVSMGLPPSKEHSMREEQALPEMPETFRERCLDYRGAPAHPGINWAQKAYEGLEDCVRAYGLACFNAGRAEGGKDAMALLAEARDHVEYGTRRYHDGVGGYERRNEATALLERIDAAMAPPAAMPNKDQK